MRTRGFRGLTLAELAVYMGLAVVILATTVTMHKLGKQFARASTVQNDLTVSTALSFQKLQRVLIESDETGVQSTSRILAVHRPDGANSEGEKSWSLEVDFFWHDPETRRLLTGRLPAATFPSEPGKAVSLDEALMTNAVSEIIAHGKSRPLTNDVEHFEVIRTNARALTVKMKASREAYPGKIMVTEREETFLLLNKGAT